jgi:hypothetical protein
MCGTRRPPDGGIVSEMQQGRSALKCLLVAVDLGVGSSPTVACKHVRMVPTCCAGSQTRSRSCSTRWTTTQTAASSASSSSLEALIGEVPLMSPPSRTYGAAGARLLQGEPTEVE